MYYEQDIVEELKGNGKDKIGVLNLWRICGNKLCNTLLQLLI